MTVSAARRQTAFSDAFGSIESAGMARRRRGAIRLRAAPRLADGHVALLTAEQLLRHAGSTTDL